MSIFDRIRSQFPILIRERGSQYYQQGRVSLSYAGKDLVMANVRGSELYCVNVDVKDGVLRVACDCPHAEGGDYCKHIYAVLLMIENHDLLNNIKLFPDFRMQLVPDDIIMDDDANVDDDDDEIFYSEIRSIPTPAWAACLDDIEAAFGQQTSGTNAARTEEREIVYILREHSMHYYEGRTQNLAVNIQSRTRKKNGDWGKSKPLNISADALAGLPAEDAAILSMLLGAQNVYDYSRYHYGESTFLLRHPLADVVLPPMAATGRLFFLNDRDETLVGPLQWHPEDIWTPALKLEPDAAQDHYELTADLRQSSQTMPASQPLVISRQGVMLVGQTLCRLNAPETLPWIDYLRKRKRISVPKEHIHDFIGRIYSLPGLPSLSFPDNLKVEEIQADAQCCLALRTEEAHYYLQDKRKFRATLYFRYRNHSVSSQPAGRGFYAEQEGCFLLRDAKSEKDAQETLLTLGFKPARDKGDDATHEIGADKFARVVSELTARGWHVEADGKLYREAGSFSFNVTTGIDWFELDGACDFENQKATLPALLAALQKKQSLVELPDGTFGVIPENLLDKYAFLARMGEVQDGRVRFKKSQAGLLDALLAAEPQATCDALFENTRRQLQSFSGIDAVAAPESFQGTLRHYQKDALGWFGFLRQFGFGGCLADDMGLGKTVQVLALLETRRLLRQYEIRQAAQTPAGAAPSSDSAKPAVRTSLVVAPRSVVFNWQKEAARFTPRLTVLDHTGQTRKVDRAHFENYDLVLTTYGTLRRDAPAFRDMEFDYIILDEAQTIKNADTASAKAVRLLKARHRLALSGTPVENHLSDLWSLFEFLNPGLLGSASVFKRTATDTTAAAPENRALLARALKPFILRRTKAFVAPELPQKTEQVIYCEMDKAQGKLYNELRDHYRRSLLAKVDREGMGKTKMHILEALLRLRQAACHPGLLDDKWKTGASAKTEFLLPQLSEILEEGHKALVFSQFTSFLSIVKKQLDDSGQRYLYLDGKTKDREKLVRTFQEDANEPLFLISLRAGGLGLNLTAAEYVYLLDPWWNPAVEAQAIDRTHRIGQTEQVFAYRLITRNTVEERVLELQHSKRDLFSALIREDTSLLGGLGREDLELLLS